MILAARSRRFRWGSSYSVFVSVTSKTRTRKPYPQRVACKRMLKNSRYLRWEFKCGTWHSNMYMISSTYFQVFRMLLDKNYPGAVCRSDYTQLFLQLSHNSSLSSQLSFDTGILRTKPNSMRTVLAVDVGGTYTRLSLVEISRP